MEAEWQKDGSQVKVDMQSSSLEWWRKKNWMERDKFCLGCLLLRVGLGIRNLCFFGPLSWGFNFLLPSLVWLGLSRLVGWILLLVYTALDLLLETGCCGMGAKKERGRGTSAVESAE
ncbi:hypothetical protein B0H65DRAFT_143781 [Neurospora tetraspora]|uniref:Uncharacterized protein n=1 Tax=Neurospora tetraspora TaxID=94610 RepID=A0AAE0JLT9_9PEZI|nr:hypothetical protein B0H65DRAFT_143781 [Neurospora tetraspora]